MFKATSFTFFGSLGFFGSGAFDGEAFGILGPYQNVRVTPEFAQPPSKRGYHTLTCSDLDPTVIRPKLSTDLFRPSSL